MYRKIFYFFVFYLFPVCIFGQDTLIQDQQIFKTYFYKNGLIASEGFLKNDKPNGLWKSFYVSGIKKSEGKWLNNSLDSIWIFFNELGDTTEKISYYLGKKNGYDYKYFTDEKNKNKIQSKELYLNGLRNGTSCFYYANGEIKEIIPYTDDKKNGIAFEYDEKGLIISIYRFRNNDILFYEKINRYNSDGLKEGVWKTFNEEGNLVEEKTYKNGKLNGYVKNYNSSGFLISTFRYENDEPVENKNQAEKDVEIKEEYDELGNLIFQGGFFFDTPIGIHRYYNSNGNVIKSKVYNTNGNLLSEGIINNDGSKHGKWTEYFEEGNIQAEGNFLNDKKNGRWTYYHKNGKIQQTGSYINGNLTGLWKWFHENGSLLMEETFILGLEDGESIEYNEHGDTISKGLYIQGNKEGEWFYIIGDMISKGNYVMGQKDGLWKQFYNSGNLYFKGRFVQGNEDGKHEYYYPDGKILEERYYSDGKKIKSWVKYKINGEPLLVIQYKNNTEYKVNGIKIRNKQSEE